MYATHAIKGVVVNRLNLIVGDNKRFETRIFGQEEVGYVLDLVVGEVECLESARCVEEPDLGLSELYLVLSQVNLDNLAKAVKSLVGDRLDSIVSQAQIVEASQILEGLISH